jgi:hypothetical protein
VIRAVSYWDIFTTDSRHVLQYVAKYDMAARWIIEMSRDVQSQRSEEHQP